MRLHSVYYISVVSCTCFGCWHPSSGARTTVITASGTSQWENQIWRIKTNEELDKLIKHKNIVNHIKAQRLSWVGHVQRMPYTRTVKKIFKWNPLTKRSQGRPKYRWEDSVKQDICQMRVKNWITCVQDRGKWKVVVEKAITSNNQGSSVPEEEGTGQWIKYAATNIFILFYLKTQCVPRRKYSPSRFITKAMHI